MATKDWTKSKVSSRTETAYYHKTKPYSLVRVWRIGLSSQERRRRGIGLYGFFGRVRLKGRETKQTFKKRSSALNAARAYMGKH